MSRSTKGISRRRAMVLALISAATLSACAHVPPEPPKPGPTPDPEGADGLYRYDFSPDLDLG